MTSTADGPCRRISGAAPRASSSSVNWIARTALARGSGTRLTFADSTTPSVPSESHQQLGQVERPIAAGELVEVVAHDAAQHLRVAPRHLVGVRARQLAHGAIAARLEAVAGAGRVERLGRERAEMRHRSVREHDVLLEHVVDGLAVVDRSGAARVVGHHAAQRGAAGGGDVRREAQPVRPQAGVELVEHDARLDACPAFLDVHIEHRVQILRGVHHQAGADGLAALGRAAPAQRDRAPEAGADADDGDRGPAACVAAPLPAVSACRRWRRWRRARATPRRSGFRRSSRRGACAPATRRPRATDRRGAAAGPRPP